MTECYLYKLPNDKISELTNLKAFSEKKLNVAKMTITYL